MYRLIYSDEATEEFEKSTLWYLIRSPQAAENFAKELQSKLRTLRQSPHVYRRKYKDFYEVNLSKYPFAIVYKIEESSQQIYVVSVYHHKRNPKRKYKR